jgi:hypothetical protein
VELGVGGLDDGERLGLQLFEAVLGGLPGRISRR